VRYAMVAAKSCVRLAKERVRRDRTPKLMRPYEIDVAVHIVGRSVSFVQLWGK